MPGASTLAFSAGLSDRLHGWRVRLGVGLGCRRDHMRGHRRSAPQPQSRRSARRRRRRARRHMVLRARVAGSSALAFASSITGLCEPNTSALHNLRLRQPRPDRPPGPASPGHYRQGLSRFRGCVRGHGASSNRALSSALCARHNPRRELRDGNPRARRAICRHRRPPSPA